MSKRRREKQGTPSTYTIFDMPKTSGEMINKYGTYNIQPTADTENYFPAIAQGMPNQKAIAKKKDKE